MIVSINQPAYLPWLGYFQRIAACDLHVVLDHVQFEKNSFVNRNRVRAGNGPTWLTVPVITAGKFGDLALDTLEIDNRSAWASKHWKTLAQAYRRAPHFKAHEAFFADLYSRRWERLADLCEAATSYLLGAFGISTRIVRSSAMHPTGQKDELVLNLCRAVGATTYYSGALGAQYLRPEPFSEAGIHLSFQQYRHPVYPQGSHAFESGLAAIDLLFWCGDDSLRILTADQVPITP